MIRCACLLMLMTLSGCAAAGLASYVVSGPPTVPAKYIPLKVPTVVMAENPRLPIAQMVGPMIARDVTQQLAIYEVAPVVAPDKIDELRMKDARAFRARSIQSIGRTVGAEQVLLIELQEYAIQMDAGSDMIRGQTIAIVRFVSVQDGTTLWPEDSVGGFPIEAKVPYAKLSDGASEASLRIALNKILSIEIGRLFRDYKPDEVLE